MAGLPPPPHRARRLSRDSHDDPRSMRGGGGPPPAPFDRERDRERDYGARRGGPRDERGASPGYYNGPPPPMYEGRGGGGSRRDSWEDQPYDRRGMRSPEFEGRGKRRRSISPPPMRGGGGGYYEDPPRRDSRDFAPPPRDFRPPYRDERDNLHPPPPRGGGRGGRGGERGGDPYAAPPPPAGRPEPEAPHLLPYQVTFRFFTDWFRETSAPSLAQDEAALQSAWKKYLAEFMRRELRPHFEQMREMRWFEEKYREGEGREKERDERRQRGREGRVREWVEKAEKGEWEGVQYEFDEEAFLKPPPPVSNGTVPAASETKPSAPSSTNGDAEPKPEEEKPTVEPAEKKKPVVDGLIPTSPETVLLPARPERLVLEGVPPNVATKDLEAAFADTPGFVRLALSEPSPHTNWFRTGWATFETAEDASKAVESLADATVSEYKLVLRPLDAPVELKIRATPAIMSDPARLLKDLDQVAAIIAECEKGEAASEAMATDGEEKHKLGSEVIRALKEKWESEFEEKKEDMDEEARKKAVLDNTRKTLDLSLHYLRNVFHTCYYCAVQCDFPEQLESVCVRHVRRIGRGGAQDRLWAEGLDNKLPLLMDKSTLDLRDFGAEVLSGLCQPHIKNEEEGKFRCKECNKLFSARKFVEKHVATKHPQFIGDAMDRVAFFNNYILDPAHQPFDDFQRMNFLPSVLAPPPPPPALAGMLGSAPPLADRIGGRSEGRRNDHKRQRRDGPPPPPPQGQALDPRAGRGASSYADLDGAPGAGVDVIALPY
ncbi:hypothetical protein JCM1840_006709 [Sporobolomyces johnsonii]